MALEVPSYASSPARATCCAFREAQGPGQGNLGLEQWTHLARGDWCLAPLGQKTCGGRGVEQGDWSKLRVGWSIGEPHTS